MAVITKPRVSRRQARTGSRAAHHGRPQAQWPIHTATASVFFFLGGMEASLIWVLLIGPDQDLLSADGYNQLFTMHGFTVVFLAIMPLAAAFVDYLSGTSETAGVWLTLGM